MASQAPDVTSTCLVCFENRALKIVGNCKHSFCIECLSTVLDSLESAGEVFACPSCKVDCPRPLDGVNGLLDYFEDTDTDIEPTVTHEEHGMESKTGAPENKNAVDVFCDLCDFKQKKVQAASICSECDYLNFCKDCSKAHGTSKATKDHILTSLLTQRQGEVAMCTLHHRQLIKFCQTCETPLCTFCVLLDHGEHDVEYLADTIRSNMDILKVTLGQREVTLKEIQELQEELTLLKAMAPIVDKQDALIKQIEDRAEKCIEQIVKWKEDLKKQVKMDYKVIRDIPECLEKVSGIVQQLQQPINRAIRLLSETEHHPEYIDKLQEMQQDLEAIAKTGNDVEGRKFRDQLMNLNSDDHSFAPEILQISCGKICKSPKTGKFEPTEIFHHKMLVDSEDMYIPCVAVLGHEYYAVAHPVKPGQPAEAIDIYEFPGTLKNTLSDHVPPFYDMTSTPDGKLAVLSNGTAHTSCSVKLFDAETGYISSTPDIGDTEPLSLGVTLKQEYVILSQNQGRGKLITVVDKAGVVKHIHNVTAQDIGNVTYCTRITCGGRFIFAKRPTRAAVYEIQDTGLQRITTCPPAKIPMGNVMDISATMWNNLFLTDIASVDNEKGKIVYLTCFQDKENKLEWQQANYKDVHRNVTGADIEARVSTRDGHTVVMTHGQTIRVFKC